MAAACFLLILSSSSVHAFQRAVAVVDAVVNDGDGDGLSDALEAALLERFVPSFRISAAECDGRPARFVAGAEAPVVESRDGTIYGRVFPHGSSGSLEIHFYHLWARDCGRAGHELDAEHVSVLVRSENFSEDASEWKAAYWFAAAHQETICDASNGAKAADIGAVDRGAAVWISHGKHASFLSEGFCARMGCGGDRCSDSAPMTPADIINIGEPGALLNGAVWVQSPAWPLHSRMGSDFDEKVISQLEQEETSAVVHVNDASGTVKAIILSSGHTVDAFAMGSIEGGSALFLGGRHGVGGGGLGLKHAGKALLRVTRSLGRIFGLPH